MKIALYGIGNFGYALLKHFDQKNDGSLELVAYDVNDEVRSHLLQHHSHPYLHTDVALSEEITVATDPQQLLQHADVLLLAVASQATREVITHAREHLPSNAWIVNTAKALDYETGQRLSELVAQEMQRDDYSYAMLSGGTIAADLFAHEPLGVDIASAHAERVSELVSLFQSPTLSVYPTADIAGVEYASAFKNVIAILAGIIAGMGFSYGSETHVISRAAAEIEDVLTTNTSAQSETFSMASQSWGNDLWMSCTGNTRNRAFGILIGQGMSVAQAKERMQSEGKTVEGVQTVEALHHLPSIEQYPLMDVLYRLIHKQNTSIEEVRELITTKTF